MHHAVNCANFVLFYSASTLNTSKEIPDLWCRLLCWTKFCLLGLCEWHSFCCPYLSICEKCSLCVIRTHRISQI